MKPRILSAARRFFPVASAIAASSLLAFSSSHAATLIWDSNTGVSGIQEATGTFTWAAADAKFWNGTTNVATTNDTTTDIAQFGNGGTITPAAVINVSTQSIGGLIFGVTTTSGYTLTATSAETLTIGGSGILMNSGAQPISVGSANLGITLGAAQSWTNNDNSLLTIAGGVTNGANLLTIGGTGNTTVSGIIGNGAGGLSKSGTGTLTLSSTANSYTGDTTITQGTLILNGSLASTVLNLGGGTLTYTRTGGTTQTFTTTNIKSGASTASTVAGNTLNLGDLTRDVGGTLNFGNLGSIITSEANTTAGIIGGWATFNNANWAVANGGSAITGAPTYYTTTTGGTTGSNYTNVRNMDVSASVVMSGTINPSTVRFNVLGVSTVTLDAGDNIIDSGGILVTSTVGNNLSTITGGNLAGSSGGDLIIHQHNSSNGLTIGSIIKNNGGATGLTKSGAGTLTLSGDNIYTGVTAINVGTLAITHINALGTTAGNTTIASTGSTTTGGRLQLGATSNTIFAENITVTGNSSGGTGAINNSSQRTHTLSGNITLSNLTGGIRFDTNNSGSNMIFSGTIEQTGSSQALILSTNASGGQNITVNNPIALNGGTLQVQSGGFSLLKGVDASDGTGIGQTVITAGGTLRLGVSDALNTTANLNIGNASATDTGTFSLLGFSQTVNALVSGGSSAIRIVNNNHASAPSTLTVGNGGGSGTFLGTIVNGGVGTLALIKTGVGTQTLDGGVNTYSGATSVNGGRLSIGTTGTINGTSGVSIGAGEFNYNNSTTALTQGITFSGSTGTLSGTGTITPAVTITSGNRQTSGTSVTSVNTTATLGKQTFGTGITYNTGSIFEWNLNSTTVGTRGTDFDAVNTAALAGTGAIFRVILNGTENFSESFWDTSRTWSGIFKNVAESSTYDMSAIFSSFEYQNSAGTVVGVTGAQGSFTFTNSGTDLTWTAVPEPSSALAGLLVGAGLLRRRRHANA